MDEDTPVGSRRRTPYHIAVKPGMVVGHFRLQALLGRGGMGEVWQAQDLVLGREVALKFLPHELLHDHDAVVRLRREAKALAVINHPGVAAVYELEEMPDPENPERVIRAIVMELVKGESLEKILSRGPLPVETVMLMAFQLASALQAAHGEGIVHRDLKPSNVMVDRKGNVKILDFGLARFKPMARSTDHERTWEYSDSAMVVGTAPYMPPEQILGEEADEKSDVWAFACTVFEMLCGQRLVQGAHIPEIVGHILEGKLNWNALPPRVPRALRTLLRACCAREREKRPSTQEIIATLQRLRQRPQVRVRALAAVAVLALGFFTSRLLWPVKHAPLLDPDRRLTVCVHWDPSKPSLARLGKNLEQEVAAVNWLSLTPLPEAGVILSLEERGTVVTLEAASQEGGQRRRLALWEAEGNGLASTLLLEVLNVLEREQIRRDLASDDAFFGFLVDRTAHSAAARSFREGLRLYERTRYLEARGKFSESLQADAQFWPAPLFLAFLAKGTANFSEARRRLAEAHALCPRPTPTEAVILEAAEALIAEDHQRQEEALTQALAVFPASGYLLYRMAVLYRVQDRPEKAIPLAKKLIKQAWRPDFSPTWELLAHCQLLAGKPKDALRTCTEAQRRFPTRYRHWLYAAFAYHQMGQQTKARQSLEEALRKYLDYSATPRLTIYQFGQYWASLLAWNEKRHELWNLVFDEAERLLKENPNDTEAQQAKGEALVALGRPDEALPLLRTLAQSEGADAYAAIALARAYAALGEGEQAHLALEQAEKRWQGANEVARGTLAYNIAVAWANLGQLQRATLWLSRSQELYGFDRLDLHLDPDLKPLRQAGLLRQFETRRQALAVDQL